MPTRFFSSPVSVKRYFLLAIINIFGFANFLRKNVLIFANS